MLPKEKLNLSNMSDADLDTLVLDAMKDVPQGVDSAIDTAVQDFTPGAIVKGRVVEINPDVVVMDIGYKSEGVVPLQEFESNNRPAIGTEMELYVDTVDDETGAILLSKRKADRILNWQRIIESHKVGDIVSGKAIRKIKGGLLVDIGVPVFLPASQVDIRRTPDVGDYLGQEMRCVIIKIDEERRNIVLSRRKLLESERETMKKKLLYEIQRGEVRRGIVKNITDFGAFIDLGGIDGLLHITDISWSRIQHPSEVLKVDQVVDVKVLDFDLDRERISLGLKQLQENPWEKVSQKFPVGMRTKGVVVNIVPYGAFVKLEDGIEGLVHVSEMSWTQQISDPNEVVHLGQEVEVAVLDINMSKQEISLGMKQTKENPWAKVEEKYPPGTRIHGKVRNLTGFGAFVELEEGIDGLLHVSDMSWTKKIAHPSAMLQKGQVVDAIVLSTDPERNRVSLGLKQLEEDPWVSRIPAQFKPGDSVAGKVTKLTSFGAFIEIAPDLEGLLHVSEISDDKKVEKPEEALKVGQDVTVRVLHIDREERKIGLSMRTTPAAPVEEPTKPETGKKEEAGGVATRDDIRRFTTDAVRAAPTLESVLSQAVKPKSEEPAAEEPKSEDAPPAGT
jgi:small subunit ribosomal protein S1